MKKKKYNSKKAQIRLAVLFLCPWVVGMVLFSLYLFGHLLQFHGVQSDEGAEVCGAGKLCGDFSR